MKDLNRGFLKHFKLSWFPLYANWRKHLFFTILLVSPCVWMINLTLTLWLVWISLGFLTVHRTHLRGPNASRASVKASKLFHRGFASMRYSMTLVVEIVVVYDRNHLFGLGSYTETETENGPKHSADTETNRNQKILNWKALYQGVCKNSLYRDSCRWWS